MNEKSRYIQLINVLAIALFVILVFSQADKKFALDEVDFPVLAKAISETGAPYHYRGETDPRSLGLWHPPLYAYSLGAFVKIFGFGENTVRAFGVCCTLLSAFLCILIYRELFQTIGLFDNWLAPIFLTIFLLHPYTIANTTVPDIDSTVLPVTILIFIYVLIRRLPSRIGEGRSLSIDRYSLFLAALFALNLWTKLTTPLLLIPVAFLVFIVKGWSLRRSVVVATTIGVIGSMIFLVTYWLYCYSLSLPFDFTFRWLMFSFTKNASSGGGISSLFGGVISHLAYTKQFINWIGLPFLFACSLAFGALIFQRARTGGENVLLILGFFGLFVAAFYLSLTGAFGGFFKYPYPIFPILVMVVAHYLHSHLFLKQLNDDSIRVSCGDKTMGFGHRQIWPFVLVVVALSVSYYQLTVTRDFVIFKDRPVPFLVIFLIVFIAVVLSALFVKKSKSVLPTYLVSVLLGIMVGSQFGISRSQAIAVYPTKYHYGQTGFDETVSYLKERLSKDEPVWSMKDIGHYVNGKYIENYSSIFKTEMEINRNLQDVITNKGARYFVVTKGIGQDRVDAYSDFKLALDSCCYIDQEFGNFVIYKAKSYE